MNDIQVFNNPEFGAIRTVEINNEPWFVGKDIAVALGYKDTVNAIKAHVDDEDKAGWQITTQFGIKETTVISESGLYALVLSSKLPTAKKFKRWVTSEVLPSIRKHEKDGATDIAQQTARCVMETPITIIGGVACYEKDGTAYLKLENVARGLGFTTVATSGNEVVRWTRVEGYLSEMGVPTCGRDGYIPENVFYRLAMKAKNEAAEKFQAFIADEVIPSIRKHGAYMTPETLEKMVLTPDFGIRLLTELKAEQDKRKALEATVEEQKPHVLFSNAVSASKTTILIGALAKLLKQNGINIGQNRLFEWLRQNGFLVKRGDNRNMPTQRAMEMGLFEVKESCHLNSNGCNVITKTTVVTGKGQCYFINRFLGKQDGVAQ